MTKNHQKPDLITQLKHITCGLNVMSCPESRAVYLSALDSLIERLQSLRERVASPESSTQFTEIGKPLAQIIEFLESAKTDDLLATVIAAGTEESTRKPKRTPRVIPPKLKNDEIRKLLGQDLSRQELNAIAVQRGISPGKGSADQVKHDILRVLDRQEGYERLASPQPRNGTDPAN